MRVKYKFIGLLVIISLLGCTNEGSDNLTKNEKQVSQTQIRDNTFQLASKDINTTTLLATVRSMEYHNNRLYISELLDSDSLVKILDIPEKQIIGHLIQNGKGPNELTFADRLSIHNGYLSLTNSSEFKVYKQPIIEGQHIEWASEDMQVTQLVDVFADKIIPINDKIFATYYAGEKVARFVKVDRSGKLEASMGDLPPHPDSATIDKKILTMIFTVKSAIRPDDERFALAYEFEDRIEIYDDDANLLYTAKGPDFYHPEFVLNERKNGRTMVRGKTRNSCIKLYTTLNEIWTLYSGEIVYPIEGDFNASSNSSNTILVFDWEGNFLRKYQLDIPIYNFCLDSKNKILYGITEVNDNHIVEFVY